MKYLYLFCALVILAALATIFECYLPDHGFMAWFAVGYIVGVAVEKFFVLK